MAVSHVKSDTIADFTGTFTGFNSQGSTTTIAATDVVRPSDWNSAHNQFYTLSGNTTNASTASGTNVVFQGAGGVTLAGSTGSIIFSVQPDRIVSHFPYYPLNMTTSTMNSGTTALSSTSIVFYLAPMVVDDDVHYNRVMYPVSGSTVAGTGSWSAGYMVGLYTLNGGTAFSLERSWFFNAALSQNSVTAHSMQVYWGTNSTSNSTSWAGNSSGSMTGPRWALMSTGQSTLTAGVYYAVIGYTHRTSGASIGAINGAQFVVGPGMSLAHGLFGTNVSSAYFNRWIGSFSTTTTGTTTGPTAHGMPASINTSALSSATPRWPIVHLGSS